jgi:hypothetical protein
MNSFERVISNVAALPQGGFQPLFAVALTLLGVGIAAIVLSFFIASQQHDIRKFKR